MKIREKGIALVAAGILIGASAFGGGAAYAAGILAERSNSAVYVDGRLIELEAYNINGANYVKLRDLGKAVNFNVYWDGDVRIESDAPYTGQAPASTGLVETLVRSSTVSLPTDGSKYIPKVGDVIACNDGTTYEIKDVTRWENNIFAPGPLPELPTPTCDWSLFDQPELPKPEARHYATNTGEDLFIRNLYETRRMQYTAYNALGMEPAAWRDGKPLAKVLLTIPAEDDAYTKYFWPWRASELEKHIHHIPNMIFRLEAWDYYHNGVFQETRYFVDIT